VYILPYIEQGAIFNQWQFNNNSGYVNSANTNLVNKVTIKTYRCPSSPLPDFYASSNNAGSIEMMSSYTGVSGSINDSPQSTGICCNGSGNIVGGGGVLIANGSLTIVSITDGTSNTIMVGEQSDHLRDASNQPVTGPYTAITSQGPHGWTMGIGSTGVGGNAGERVFNCSTTRWQINQRGLGDNSANGTNNNTGSNIPFSSGHTNGAMMLFGDGGVRFVNASTPAQTLQWLSTRAGGETLPNF
jgi:hypothetical protein